MAFLTADISALQTFVIANPHFLALYLFVQVLCDFSLTQASELGSLTLLQSILFTVIVTGVILAIRAVGFKPVMKTAAARRVFRGVGPAASIQM